MPDAHLSDLIPALDQLVRLLATARHEQVEWALRYVNHNAGCPVELVITHPADHQAAIERYAAAIVARAHVGMASDRRPTRIEARRGVEDAVRQINEALTWIRRTEQLDRVAGQ